MPRRQRSTHSPSYVEISDRSDGSDGDVAEIFSPVKRSTRIRKQQGSEMRSVRPARSTRVTKAMRDAGSDIEFIGESPASSRPASARRSVASVKAPAPKGRPRSTFLGVYIPKLRPSPEMIREMREKRAAEAEAAGHDDFVAVTVERGSSAQIVPVESSAEDEEDIDNDLGVALKRAVSNGGARGPSSVKATSPKKKKARRPPSPDSSDDDAPRRKSKGKQRRRDSDSDEAPRRKAKGKERLRRDLDDSDSDVVPQVPRRKHRKDGERSRKRRRNSDDDIADEGLDEIELDEPERFKTKSRLREVKKNAFQERLGSLQKKRRGKVFGAKKESSSEENSSEEDDRRRGRAGPSKRKSSQWKYVEDDLSDFIASDDDIDGVAAPRGRGRDRDRSDELEAFTFKRETPEYKFKVVFQYLLVLAIQGPDALLPLRGKNDQYYGRSLRNVRDQMNGVKSSISSVLWRPEFVKALKKYPQWKQARLDEEEDHCEACNRSKQACKHEAWLRGSPYHPEKHEDVYDQERAELLEAQRRRRRKYKKQGRESSSSDSDDPREIGALGATCLTRTNLWHELHHWEHRLYNDIRHYYHDLLRGKGDDVETDSDSQLSAASDATAGAKSDLKRRRAISLRRVAELKSRRLPRDAEDVDEVTEWMDAQGYQKDAMRYLTRLEDRARELDRR